VRSDQGLGENAGWPVGWYAMDISIQLLTHIDYGNIHKSIADLTYKGCLKSLHAAAFQLPG
jgi:hypothetical protein